MAKPKLISALFAAVLAVNLGCKKADEAPKPKHIYFVGAVVVRKYVVEGNYEVILKRTGGSCPRELLDMKTPVSFPVDPDVWKSVVDHNRMIIVVQELKEQDGFLQNQIDVYSYQTLKDADRRKRGEID